MPKSNIEEMVDQRFFEAFSYLFLLEFLRKKQHVGKDELTSFLLSKGYKQESVQECILKLKEAQLIHEDSKKAGLFKWEHFYTITQEGIRLLDYFKEKYLDTYEKLL